jgi:hypothetical protein
MLDFLQHISLLGGSDERFSLEFGARAATKEK